jgi:hypothetical protein
LAEIDTARFILGLMLAFAGLFGALVLTILFGSPWIVASVWLWRRRPRDGEIPPSLGEQLRRRLWIQ